MLIQVFVFLQLLDCMTTLTGFRLGAAEASLFIRMLQHFGPVFGVALSKGLALGLGAICVWLKKDRIIGWINYWYAGLVTWNLCIILQTVASKP